MFRSHRFVLVAIAVAGTAFFAQVASADGNTNYPSFASIAGGQKMLNRDAINKLDETKYPALAGLKSHFTDADLDHDGTINKYEYDLYMSNPKD